MEQSSETMQPFVVNQASTYLDRFATGRCFRHPDTGLYYFWHDEPSTMGEALAILVVNQAIVAGHIRGAGDLMPEPEGVAPGRCSLCGRRYGSHHADCPVALAR